MFLIAGSRKAFQSSTKLLTSSLYHRIPLAFTRVLGVLEISGAIGITLPLFMNIYPVLATAAAACMAIVLFGATIVHVQREEYKTFALIVIFLMLAITVVYLRLKVV
jgi:hypothetical protein